MISMKNLPMKNKKTQKPPKVLMWNTNKPGGWENYNEKTKNNEVFDAISKNDDMKKDPELMMKSIDKELNAIKFDCFGKVRYRKNFNESDKLTNLYKQKQKSNSLR